MARQPRLTKAQAQRLLHEVEAAGDDVEAVRRAVGAAAGAAVEALLAGMTIEELWDLAAELNERRTL